MKKVLRILSIRGGNKWVDLPETITDIPRKGDSVVYNEDTYRVSYVEFDFDEQTVFIVVIK